MDHLLHGLARISLADRPVGDVLTEIVQLSERGIPGAEAVSVTLVHGDQASTAAYSAEMALHAEELQYERGYGPCLDAGRGAVVLRIDDMGTEQGGRTTPPRSSSTAYAARCRSRCPTRGRSSAP